MTIPHSDIIEQTLSTSGVITYRLLSRAASIQVNQAKRILYAYHHTNQPTNPALTATYILSGTRKLQKPDSTPSINVQDEDTVMASQDSIMMSSPAPSSPPQHQQEEEKKEDAKEAVVILVGEGDFEETKKTMEFISSCHVYSIQTKLDGLSKLGEVEDRVRRDWPVKEMVKGGEYGGIVCEGVEYRGRQPPPPAMPSAKPKAAAPTKAAAKPEPKKPEPKKEEPVKKETPSKEEKKSSFFGKPPTSSTTTTTEKKTPASSIPAKRTQADFFKRAPSSSTSSAPPKKAQKTSQKLEVSDDEDDAPPEPKVERDLAKEEALRKKKAEDEAALKAMMEMDDDDTEMLDAAPVPGSPDWDEPADEPEEEASNPIDKPAPAPEPEPKEIAVETSNGRRRGRRKVKKARTVRDEKGYLETKFEEVWESYSEDEPEVKKPVFKKELKKAPPKKGGKGQGNIMSFFGKK